MPAETQRWCPRKHAAPVAVFRVWSGVSSGKAASVSSSSLLSDTQVRFAGQMPQGGVWDTGHSPDSTAGPGGKWGLWKATGGWQVGWLCIRREILTHPVVQLSAQAWTWADLPGALVWTRARVRACVCLREGLLHGPHGDLQDSQGAGTATHGHVCLLLRAAVCSCWSSRWLAGSRPRTGT